MTRNLYVARSKSITLSENKSCALSNVASMISGECMYFEFFIILQTREGELVENKDPHRILDYDHYICYEYI